MSQSSPITLYALSTCIHCKHTKEFLDRCGVIYDCIFVDKLTGDERKAMVEHIKTINPKLSFPTILINGEAIIGFKEEEIEEALRNL
jgi:glutaredoxin-like protein NrdH